MCLGVQQSDNARLKIKTFYLQLSGTRKHVPNSVTLCYLPRINGSSLDINGSWIRPDTPGFVTLHRVVSGGEVVFGSCERVRVSEGTRFEVYVEEDKLIKGIFRRDEGDEDWKMDIKSVLEREIGVRETEVCVEVEGVGALREKVEVVVRREKSRMSPFMRRYTSSERYCFRKLEEIPEQREGEVMESDGHCCCSECNDEEEIGSDRGNEVDVEGMSWAVDVGIWVMCLGVGYLVSKASSKTRIRKIIL